MTDEPLFKPAVCECVAVSPGPPHVPTPLSTLRMLFFAFSLGIALISFVAVPILAAGSDSADKIDPAVPTAVVFVIGLALHLVGQGFSRPDRFSACGSRAQLVAMFRTQFMLRIALAEASALCGFVAFIVTANVIPYAVGVAWTILGFIRIAPTRRHLERLQDDLALQGCPYQLLDTLENPIPTT